MIRLEHDIEYGTEIELVFADVIAERSSVELDFLRLGRKLGRAQFRGCMVPVLVQYKSVDHGARIAREAHTDSGNPSEKLVGRRREDRERALSGCLGEKPVVHTENL